uniref:Uncharacterized protein n=1 Tax=Tanacetum cinerariifolium TaxID=118510 RepID=A0A699IXK0_TANCI|nr:hypothetical protein [Tanacetum cinerariifolium]
MRRVGKGLSGVDTPLFEGMLVPQQVNDDVSDDVVDVVADAKPTSPSLATTPPHQQELIPSTSQGRLEKSQALVYHLDLEHADKVLIDDRVAATTTAASTITAAPMTTASAVRRRNGVVIRDPEETTTASVIVHSEPKSKDKGKGILAEEL